MQILLLTVVKAQVSSFKKRLLITGVNGFVGRNFISRSAVLEQFNTRVSARNYSANAFQNSGLDFVVADLRDQDTCFDLCKGVDVVLNLAGVMMTAASKNQGHINSVEDNLGIHLNLAKAAKRGSVEKYIWFSSTTGYPVSATPLREEQFQEGFVPERYYLVGNMYRFLEVMLDEIFRGSRSSIATLRPTGIFGEWDDFSIDTGHVLPTLIAKCAADALPEKIIADKEECRDWIYVGNIVRVIDYLLLNSFEKLTLNIGAGSPTNMFDLHKLIFKLMGSDANCELIESPLGSNSAINRHIDCSRSREVLDEYVAGSFEEDLLKTISWYRSEIGKVS